MTLIELKANTQLGGLVKLEGSKSLTARALVMAALNKTPVMLINPSESEDSQSLLNAFTNLGIKVIKEKDSWQVSPPSNFSKYNGEINVGPAGTSMRFLCALISAIPGLEITLSGSDRMHQRPIADLVEALRKLGADISYLNTEGCPPLKIIGKELVGKSVMLSAAVSSQYLTAILLIAPLFKNGLEIKLSGPPVSESYIDMTLACIKKAGVNIERPSSTSFKITANSQYDFINFDIEGDASGATYLWGLAALSQSEVTVVGLGMDALQGDARFPLLLEKMGCEVLELKHNGQPAIRVKGPQKLQAISADLTLMPDTAQTLAVLCALAKGTSTLSGLSTLRHKETDRISALQIELGKVGIQTQATNDSLTIIGGVPHSTTIETYEDHRMAMSFAMLAPVCPGIKIQHPQVVGKSFPSFWNVLEQLGVNSQKCLNTQKIVQKIVLIGFMGAGKSSVAANLSEALGWQGFDLDLEILKKSAFKSIPDIFSSKGEDYFRALETNTLEQVLKGEKFVLAAGGGTPIKKENIELLKAANAMVIYLSADFEEILNRIPDRSGRPLLNDLQAAKELYNNRLSVYEKLADFTVSTSGESVAAVVNKIKNYLYEN